MPTEHEPTVVAVLQARFAHFARQECPQDPLYVALSEAASLNADWAALLAEAPPTQQFPTVWLAALHDRVLQLVEDGERPALADYYASTGPARAPDDALLGHLGEFIARERATLIERIATRTNQTNEIGRCAVLWPVLQALVEKTGHRRVSLLDVGCSAGLNLGVDRWRYRYVDDLDGHVLGNSPADRDPGAPEITCRVLAGSGPLRAGTPEIVGRAGLDQNPIAIDDASAVRWLRACLWPHDATRRERFEAAVKVARAQRWPVSATTDATAAVDAWLTGLADDVTPVVFNSWVLAYFDPATLRRHVAQLTDWICRRGVVWISAESPLIARTGWPALPPAPARGSHGSVDQSELDNATVWTLARPDGQGGVAWELIARSHAHGRWMSYEA